MYLFIFGNNIIFPWSEMTIPAFLGKWVPIFPMYFYKNLLEIMHRNDYGLEFIYNIDETGVTIVPDSEKVIANTGIRSVGRILSAEIAQIIVTRVIIICAINAIGNSFLAIFIFYELERNRKWICMDQGKGLSWVHRGFYQACQVPNTHWFSITELPLSSAMIQENIIESR